MNEMRIEETQNSLYGHVIKQYCCPEKEIMQGYVNGRISAGW